MADLLWDKCLPYKRFLLYTFNTLISTILENNTWLILQSSAKYATMEALAKVWRIQHASRTTMEKRDARARRDSSNFQKRTARFRRGSTWLMGSLEVRIVKTSTVFVFERQIRFCNATHDVPFGLRLQVGWVELGYSTILLSWQAISTETKLKWARFKRCQPEVSQSQQTGHCRVQPSQTCRDGKKGM